MEILEKPNGKREGFASLANIGYNLFEVNLEGEVYSICIPNKVEHVGNRWKVRKYDVLGNPIEQAIRTDVLVGCAWYNVDEKLWENSTYADTIRRCKEFFSISTWYIAKTNYQTKNGFSYNVTKFGEVWNTETMTKVKVGISSRGYRYVILGSVHNVKVHRLVAYHFVRVSKDSVDQRLSKKNLVVNHLDGNKLNNRWDNLEWTTQRKPYKLDKATIFSIYDEFTSTDKSNSELSRKYNVSYQFIAALRTGRIHSDLAHEYINSKGLAGYWQRYRHPK